MNKARYYIDWITIKAVGFIYYMAGVLEKYDHVLDVFTKNIGRIGVLLGVITVIIRLYKTAKNKGANGD